MTDFLSVHSPTMPTSTDKPITYLSMTTMTSTIASTQFITTTATIIASNCPNIATVNLNTSQSPVATSSYNSSTVMMLPSSPTVVTPSDHGPSLFSGLPENGTRIPQTILSTPSSLLVVTSSGNGTSSFSGLRGSGAFSSSSSFSTRVDRSSKFLSSISVYKTEASSVSGVDPGVSARTPSGLVLMSKLIPVAKVRNTDPTSATSMSPFNRRTFAVGLGVAHPGLDYTQSSIGPSVDTISVVKVTDSGATKTS